MEPKFLTIPEILEIHKDQISRYGGDTGIRDIDLLKSAIGMPSATFNGQYLHVSIYEMAAAYLFHLVQNHPFVDGNKRVGAVSALIFLILNDYDFEAPEDDFSEMVLRVAKGELDKAGISMFIRQWAKKV
ncbi:MAG: type II toxin-antitoxin system death-on-curing family toxin [Deferribacterales bacterium]